MLFMSAIGIFVYAQVYEHVGFCRITISMSQSVGHRPVLIAMNILDVDSVRGPFFERLWRGLHLLKPQVAKSNYVFFASII